MCVGKEATPRTAEADSPAAARAFGWRWWGGRGGWLGGFERVYGGWGLDRRRARRRCCLYAQSGRGGKQHGDPRQKKKSTYRERKKSIYRGKKSVYALSEVENSMAILGRNSGGKKSVYSDFTAQMYWTLTFASFFFLFSAQQGEGRPRADCFGATGLCVRRACPGGRHAGDSQPGVGQVGRAERRCVCRCA